MKKNRLHRFFLLSWLLGIAMVISPTNWADAKTITITFDEKANGENISEAYEEQGVVFRTKGPWPSHPFVNDKNAYTWNDLHAISGTNVIGGRFVADDQGWSHWLGFSVGYGVARFVNPTDYVRLYGIGGPFMVHVYQKGNVLIDTFYSKLLDPIPHPTGKQVHYVEIRALDGGDAGVPIKKIEFGCIFPGSEEDLTYFDDLTFNANQYPTAHAGDDGTVYEGETVLLDGTASTDPDGVGDIVSYTWKQVEGPPVALSDETVAAPTFVVPAVDGNGDVLSFALTVRDSVNLENTSQVTFDILDNGIHVERYPAEAFTLMSATMEPMAVMEGEGTHLTRLSAIDPTQSIETLEQMPDDMRYGIINFDALVDQPGDVAALQIYFPQPVPLDYTWYKYRRDLGWINFNRAAISEGIGDGAELDDERLILTLYVTDNGPYDDDPREGFVRDPSGLGAEQPEPMEEVLVSEDNSKTGCFISTAKGGLMSFKTTW